MKLTKLSGLCLLLTVIGNVVYHAVDLSTMEVTKTYSPNRKYCLEIIPKGCEGNDSTCLGRFYALDNQYNYQLVWSRNILNTVSPSRAIVSNDGDYVVTMNEWTMGDNSDKILVVYGPGGKLIRNFTLNEIAGKDEIDSMKLSDNRRWWREKIYSLKDSNIFTIQTVVKTSDSTTVRNVTIALRNGDIQIKTEEMNLAELVPDLDMFVPVDVPARPVKQPCPHYPDSARKLEQEGIVYVKMLVDLDGTVMKSMIIKSCGYPLLDEEAAETVSKWTFTPAQFQGKPVRVWVAAPMKFELRLE